MKKYISRATKWLGILSLICFVMLSIGIVFIVVKFPHVGLQIGLTMVGGLMSSLFLTCYLAERSRVLIIDADKIILPGGIDKNGKMLCRKVVIKIDEICSVESKLYKGVALISKDTYFHTLKLKDGTKITVTLYAYGKVAEKEILETIHKNIT